MDKTRTTNYLLLIIVIPIIFYLLKVLSFIFVPLVFSMFIALLFLPLMRFLSKRKLPKMISVIIVMLVIALGIKIGVELVKLSSREILASDSQFFHKAEDKINTLVDNVE
ncbi:MAG: AI-2E family transporter, partial [Olleya sp.]